MTLPRFRLADLARFRPPGRGGAPSDGMPAGMPNGMPPGLAEGLAETLAGLSGRAAPGAGQAAGAAPAAPPLGRVPDFGANPGQLSMHVHVPADLPPGAPLVVALHGCTQDAAAYDRGCGWSAMADRHGFAVLLPEQGRGNNPNLCFNWFEPGDTARDAGEAASIRAMVDHMVRRHRLDPRRVFVTGLSAGGAMTAVMLATYPEVFAGGAILAGLPYRAATTVPQAFEAMFRGRPADAAAQARLVRTASRHAGAWPRVSIWQGDADRTVTPANAAELEKQWTALHGLDARAPEVEALPGGHARRVWRDPAGAVAVESWTLAGLGHAVPINPGTGPGRCGAAGPHIADAGLSSTHRILESWGLIPAAAAEPAAPPPRAPSGGRAFVVDGAGQARPDLDARPAPPRPDGRGAGGAEAEGPGALGEVGAVIARALRSAGLLRS